MNCPSLYPSVPNPFSQVRHLSLLHSQACLFQNSLSQNSLSIMICVRDFLLLLLKFGKYLRVYRQKSHTFWHKKTELFKKKPQDNKPIQALNMINTRKFISKNMGRLSSNGFLSCFMARNYFYKNFLRRNKHLGFGYLCLYLKYFVFCYMNHIEHKNTLSVISPVCLSPSTCVVATPHTYIAPL